MKLTTREISGYVERKPVQAAVLLYGPDRGAIKLRAEKMGRFITPDLNDPFNVALLMGAQISDDPARFFDETRAISMMGGDRLIRVQEAGDSIAETLKSYLQNPAAGTWVILEAGDLPKESKLRKLFEADKNAMAVPCYVQEGADLSRTIATSLRTASVRIDPDALELMTAAIGGDQHQVHSEIEKLITYMNPGPAGVTATYDDVAACCGAMGLATLDLFVDALLMGETKTAFVLLGRLLDDGVDMIAIVRTLLAHGRKIQSVQLRLKQGERIEEILESRTPPVFFKRKAAFATHVKKWPEARLSKMMHDVYMCEARLKSGIDPAVIIPQTFLSIAARSGRA